MVSNHNYGHFNHILQPPSMVSAECQTLTQQCSDELGLFSGSGMAGGNGRSGSADTTTTASPPSVLQPVCGTDGRTYSSRCELQKARCEGHPVRVRQHGTCNGMLDISVGNHRFDVTFDIDEKSHGVFLY